MPYPHELVVEGTDTITADVVEAKKWGHADAASATALAMVQHVGGIERPDGGWTRLRIGLCSGSVCCAVIGADQPRFR